jgi:sulfide dehydrogenase cytochrome subunit
MANSRVSKVLAAGALSLGISAGAFAEDIATGKMLVDTCAGCHGTNGNSVGPAAPSISAMDPLVFVDTMTAFKEGDTYSTIMGRIAKGYSEEEFEAMGEYLHDQPFVPAAQEFDQALVEQGAKMHDKYCEKCHIEGGKPVPEEEDYYILAGQWVPYLKNAMDDFREERRILPKKMGKKLDSMLEENGEESLAALYAFYASYTGDSGDE